MQRRRIALIVILACILALFVTPALAQQYGVIPALGPWDGGPSRVLYCQGNANPSLAALQGGFFHVSCPTWTPTAPPSPLDTPTPTATFVPTVTPTPPPTPPVTYTPTWTPTPTATATITATETIPMAIVAESFASAAGGVAEITVNKPTGTTAGDVLVALISISSQTVDTAPTGWLLVDSGQSTNQYAYLYYLVAGSSEPATYQWTFTGNSQERGIIGRYSGVDNTTPGDATAAVNTGSDAAPVGSSITTASDGAMIIDGVAWLGTQTHTFPSGMTEEVEISRSAYNDVIQASAGATGDKTSALDPDGTDWVTIMWALKPAGAGPSGNPLLMHMQQHSLRGGATR